MFGHAFSKACQYAINDEKVCKGFKYVSIKFAHANLQKCIIWPKKFDEGQSKWNKACIETNLRPRKLNALMKIRSILFLDIVFFVNILKFANCYVHI